jgi:hypothetical protein
MTPSRSCIQRFESDVALSLETATVMDLLPQKNPTCPSWSAPNLKIGPLCLNPDLFR